MHQGIWQNSLMESSRWLQFMESTATGLHMNLAFIEPGTERCISINKICPICHNPYEACDDPVEAFDLLDDYRVVTQECMYCRDLIPMPFHDRVMITHELLVNFQAIMLDELNLGKLASELTTLRQMNHIILSMFRGESKALGRALDLVLSAMVILLDARSSWLKYKAQGRDCLLVKGDKQAVSDYFEYGRGAAMTAGINCAGIQAGIGILDPEDPERADMLLPLVMQECNIVFEIDCLMKLMESRLSMVLGTVESLVLLVNKHLNISYANKTAERMLNKSMLLLTGHPVLSMDAPWNRTIAERPAKAAKGIMDVLNNQSGDRYVDWGVYPLADKGETTGWLITADDRTDFYHLQEVGEQAEKIANTSSLLSVLAHEIRNPLATFKGLLQLIKLKKDTVNIAGYIDIGIREIDRVTRLLNEFMLLGKPSDISLEPLDMKAFFEEFAPILFNEANGTDIEFQIDLKQVPPVFADPSQLTQVLLNLVRNAIEALRSHGRIKIGLRESPKDWVEISVADNGPGIPPGSREKLFQPFYTTKEGGTGLGLAVCHNIISSHGGKISADDHPDAGTVFTILLPVSLPMMDEPERIAVMVITDNELVRLPVEQVFRTENMGIVSVDSLDDAILISNRYRPSAVVLECAMLNPHNMERLTSKWPDVRIIVIGNKSNTQDDGNLYFIPQPLNYTKLISMVRSLI